MGQVYKIKDKDTGWVDIPLAANVTVGSIVGKAQCRRIGNRVYLKGDINNIHLGHVATLPQGFRPSDVYYIVTSYSGTNTYSRAFINKEGRLQISWLSGGNCKDSTTPVDVSWYNINCDFLVD